MTRLLEDAQSLLEAGQSAQPGSTAIVIGDGGMRIVSEPDAPLASLALGARRAYLIVRRAGRVVVEGREGGRTVRLESESLVPDFPRYPGILPWSRRI